MPSGPPRDAAARSEGSGLDLDLTGWPRRALLLLWIVLSGLYFTHPPGHFTGGGRAHGDGLYYYVYARSLVLDRDLDFGNDYDLLGNPHEHGRGPTGRAENRFAAGTGLLWIPTFVVAHAVVNAGAALHWIDDPGDGSSRLQQRITLYGSLLWALAAVVFGIRLAARYTSIAIATAAGITVMLASPLVWYAVYEPSWPHATSAGVVALFVWRWHEGRQARSLRGWAVLGALGGLVVLVRTQNVVFMLLPLFDLGRGLIEALRQRDRSSAELRRGVLAGLLMFACAVACFLPQMWTWATIYGDPLVIPQGSSFMRWADSRWAETLFSSRNGLFSWTPLVGASMVGLLALGLQRSEARNLVGLLLLVFVLQAYVNGSVDDWWGGWAFGGRRFVGCTAVFILGGAYGLDRLHRFAHGRPRLLATTGLVAVGLLVVSYNASLMRDYWNGDLQRGRSQPMEPATHRWASRLISTWYRVLGHPGSFPANLAHAWRAGVSPRRYDATSGWELATSRHQIRGWDAISLHDERWAGQGFGPKQNVYGFPASWVEHEATFVLPVRHATELAFVVQLRPANPDTAVQVELGGHVVFDRTLDDGWRWYRGTIPAEALTAGLNYVHVTQQLPPTEPPDILPIGKTNHDAPMELELTADPEGEAPLRFLLGRTEIDVSERGVTAFAIDPPSPDHPGYRLLGSFDTLRDHDATRRLRRAIESLPDGQVVVLGMSHNSVHRWDADGTAALASLGAETTPLPANPKARYALIGVRGAAVGTALESWVDEGPAHVVVGRRAAVRHDGVAWARLVLWQTSVDIPEEIADRTFVPALSP